MKASIVIGANYGDEGKGTIVARLTKDSNGSVLNVLTNGGSQRGHSILTADGSMTFQHFGAGTYHGADNLYSPYYILNPMQFVKEYNELIVKPAHIYRAFDCRWSTPYDVMANLITEEQKGRKASCGMGIWNTIKRCADFSDITFNDFMISSPIRQRNYLKVIRAYYEQMIDIPAHWRDTWMSEGIIDHFLEDCITMFRLTKVPEMIQYDHIIFENGQGLLLKDTGRDTADTTPSDTGITYAMRIARGLGIEDITAHYVTRPYLTRHGDGHLSGQTERMQIASTVCEDRTNHYNEHQGEFRYGLLNEQDLFNRIKEDAQGTPFVLDVTHCDEMDRIADFRKLFDNVNAHDSAIV